MRFSFFRALLKLMKSYSFLPDETFVIEGKSLKLTTKEDVEPFVKEIHSKQHIKKFVTSGNSYGIEAAKALAEALKAQESLIVSTYFCYNDHYINFNL